MKTDTCFVYQEKCGYNQAIYLSWFTLVENPFIFENRLGTVDFSNFFYKKEYKYGDMTMGPICLQIVITWYLVTFRYSLTFSNNDKVKKENVRVCTIHRNIVVNSAWWY